MSISNLATQIATKIAAKIAANPDPTKILAADLDAILTAFLAEMQVLLGTGADSFFIGSPTGQDQEGSRILVFQENATGPKMAIRYYFDNSTTPATRKLQYTNDYTGGSDVWEDFPAKPQHIPNIETPVQWITYPTTTATANYIQIGGNGVVRYNGVNYPLSSGNLSIDPIPPGEVRYLALVVFQDLAGLDFNYELTEYLSPYDLPETFGQQVVGYYLYDDDGFHVWPLVPATSAKLPGGAVSHTRPTGQLDLTTLGIPAGALFRLTQPDGTVSYSAELQDAIDEADPGASITMFADAGPAMATGTDAVLITHKNGVNIDTNGFNIPRLQDNTTSGKFRIFGGGKVGCLMLTQGTTDLEMECYYDYTAASTTEADGSLDATFMCRRVYFDKVAKITASTWLTLYNAALVTFNEGVIIGHETYAAQDVGLFILDATFTGVFRLKGTFAGKCYQHMIGNTIGSAGKIILENANVFNNGAPTDTDYNVNGAHGVLYIAASSTTEVITVGNCVLKGLGKSVFTVNRALTIQVDGELSYEGASNGTHTVTFNHTTPQKVGSGSGSGTSYTDAQAITAARTNIGTGATNFAPGNYEPLEITNQIRTQKTSTAFDGVFIQHDGYHGANAAYKVLRFPVRAGKRYHIKGRVTSPGVSASYGAAGAYAFYGSAANSSSYLPGTVVTQPATTTQATTPVLYDLYINAPAGAVSLGISQLTGTDTITVAELIDSNVLSTDLEAAKATVASNTALVERAYDNTSKPITPTYQNGYVIPNYLYPEANADYKIAIYPVEPGKTYRLKAQITMPAFGSGAGGAYCFYKAIGTPLDGGNTLQVQLTTQAYDVDVTIPALVNYLYVSQKLTGGDFNALQEIIKTRSLQTLLNNRLSTNISCWGDSITWGSAPANGRYWTLILQELVGTGFKVVNCGVGGETAVNIPARQGAIPMYNSLDFTLPALAATKVQVGAFNNWIYDGFFKSTYDDAACPTLLQGEGRDFNTINPCYIDGIECTLSITISNQNPLTTTHWVNRNVNGTARVIKAGTKVYTNAAKTLKQGATVLFMGTNGGFQTVDELIDKYKKMVAYSGTHKYVIVGLYAGSGTPLPSTMTLADMVAMEKKMEKEFGLHYLNLRKYAIEYGLSDAGITPTTADNDAIAIGKVPPSLIPDGIHPGNEFSVQIAQQVYNTLKNIGAIN